MKRFYHSVSERFQNINGLINCFQFKGNTSFLNYNVGIGTMTPAYPLEIQSSDDIIARLIRLNTCFGVRADIIINNYVVSGKIYFYSLIS